MYNVVGIEQNQISII